MHGCEERFVIRFIGGEHYDDEPLHFNARFGYGGDHAIVMNSKHHDEWQCGKCSGGSKDLQKAGPDEAREAETIRNGQDLIEDAPVQGRQAGSGRELTQSQGQDEPN